VAILISIWWLLAYLALGLLILVGTVLARLIAVADFRKALGLAIFSAALVNVGIIVHTAAILTYGEDSAQTIEFVVGHCLLLAGFLVMLWYSRSLEDVSEQVGFSR
jgi:hypothetical protein